MALQKQLKKPCNDTPTDLFQQKNELRALIANQRDTLSFKQINELSKQVTERLIFSNEFKAAATIHCYVSFRSEVRTHELIQLILKAKKRIVSPLIDRATKKLKHYSYASFDQLQPDRLGILEPPVLPECETPCDELDLVLVPGLAFDLAGNRLGYGGGYYDDFLKDVQAVKIGLAYSSQVVPVVPIWQKDEAIDMLCTEADLIRFK